MSASIKVLLRKNKLKSDGTIPLYVRVTKNRKSKFISLGVSISEKDWDEKNQRIKKSYPNSALANTLIAKKRAEIEAEVLSIELNNKVLSSDSFNDIKGKSKSDFFSFAEEYLDSLKIRSTVGTYNRYKAIVGKLKVYVGGKSLFFHEITVSFIRKYEKYLSDTLNNKPNTIHTNLSSIRTILNRAVDEGFAERDKNPFYKIKLKKAPTDRAYLTDDELRSFQDVIIEEGSRMFDTKNMFIFACYTGGLRIADILRLKWENYDGSHIILNTKKTGALVSIKTIEPASSILNYYRSKLESDEDSLNKFIFPVLNENFSKWSEEKQHLAIASATTIANNNLKLVAIKAKIKKHITFHSSRHTFGTMALRKGIGLEYVSRLMGHSRVSQTELYAKIVNEELDNAMDKLNNN